MLKGIHIFCDGAIYCPVVTSIPAILQAACALAAFPQLELFRVYYGQRYATLAVFTANNNKSRSDDDSDDNGQAALIKST
ncbi:hypothetical protein A6J66_022455 [Yersinia enterocolitica]|nr:hypothetical protein A6J66_022455 [Yersinia enterocolitica]